MHRIDTSTRQVDKFGTGKDGFTNGTPGVTPPTQLDATMFDTLQEELTGVVEGAGLGAALSTSNNAQLLALLRTMLNGSAADNYRVISTGIGTNTFNWFANGVAVGNSGVIQSVSWAGPLLSSSNPEDFGTWTSRTAGSAFAGTFTCVAYCPTLAKYVAVGYSGSTPEVQTSPTLVTWTEETLPSLGASTLRAVIEHAGLAIAVGGPGIIITSPDGATWTQRTPGSSYAGSFYRLATDGTTVVAAGTGGEIQSSTDGITWTRRVTGAAGDFLGLAYGGGVWLAVSSGGDVYRSTDGTTWAAVTTPSLVAGGHTCNFSGLTWTGKVFVTGWLDATSSANSGLAATSDGLHWWRGHDMRTNAGFVLTSDGDGRVFALGSMVPGSLSAILVSNRGIAF